MKQTYDKKVAIVIPIYNVEKYLEKCLESVVNQSYKNLEILLVNDGSTDENSFNIAKEYALKDERITLFDKENGGLSSARNVGIEYLSGDYELEFEKEEQDFFVFKITNENPLKIHKVYKNKAYFKSKEKELEFPKIDYLQFVDSDDYIELDCIKECVKRMQGVELVWFDAKIFLDGVKKSEWQSNLKWLGYKHNQIISKEDWLRRIEIVRLNFFYFAVFGMIDFSFLKRIKLKFINGIVQEDDFFGILLFLQAKHIYILPKEFYHYRIRSNSIMNYNQEITLSSIPIFFRGYLPSFHQNAVATKNYLHTSSLMRTALEIIKFLEKHNDEYAKAVISYYLLPTYLNAALELLQTPYDPLSLIPKIKSFEAYMPKKREFLGAAKRIQNSLSYRIGALVLKAKTFKKLLALPHLIKTFIKHDKMVQKLYKERLEEFPFAKLPPLEKYKDFSHAQSFKNHLSYKLGDTIIKAYKKRYLGSYLFLPFKMLIILISFKFEKKVLKENSFRTIRQEIKSVKQDTSWTSWNLQRNFVDDLSEHLSSEKLRLFLSMSGVSEDFYDLFFHQILGKNIVCLGINLGDGKLLDCLLFCSNKAWVVESDYHQQNFLTKKYQKNQFLKVLYAKVGSSQNNTEKTESLMWQKGLGISPLLYKQFLGEIKAPKELSFKALWEDFIVQTDNSNTPNKLLKEQKILLLGVCWKNYQILDEILEFGACLKNVLILIKVDFLFSQSKKWKNYEEKLESMGGGYYYEFN